MKQTGLLHPSSTLKDIIKELRKTADGFSQPERHLRHLMDDPRRFSRFSFGTDGFFMDVSRQRIDDDVMNRLLTLARSTGAFERFVQMTEGLIVNPSEKRAALHTAARGTGPSPLFVNGQDVHRAIETVNGQIREFSRKIQDGTLLTAKGAPYTHAVVVGIGGSYLGCEFVYQAMGASIRPKIPLRFMPNVDIDEFARVVSEIPPETTLWIVISKSFTTTETMANLAQVRSFLDERTLSPKHHLVTITAKGSPGDDPANPVLASFHMFDFIGGRYSVSSAVGGVPLSLSYGFDAFWRFLAGCRDMDSHTLASERSLPMMAALISVWNSQFLNYPAQAVIPYTSRLSRLPAHIQQLHMESLGKSASPDGMALSRPAGILIFGEPGTNAQHSFFQLAHQGPGFPIEFIGVVKPGFQGEQTLSKGVTNHQELWANLLAQTRALAAGREHDDPARRFEGNRPSTLIVLDALDPESIGKLLAFYEARTVLEGFILGVNPFDQFGVELGKTMAKDIRNTMAQKNRDPGLAFAAVPDHSLNFYLEKLFENA